MDVTLFDFALPDHCIALRPCVPRDHARQLIINAPAAGDKFVDSRVDKLPDYVREGDVLVLNNTRVIPSRLQALVGQAKIEMTLHRRITATEWWSFIKNGRRVAPGKTLCINGGLQAEVLEKKEDGQVRLNFHLPAGITMERALATAGQMPLPPYIASKRSIDAQDQDDYQTTYGNREGAVAAPTAGLHFTPDLLDQLQTKGVRVVYVTLHVGAGTFLPVKATDTRDHKMHAEWGEITPETADMVNTARQNGGRIIAVGTTSLRLLESAADANGTVKPFSTETAIFITPGYKFRVVDMLMTNFHLPKSTLFMLVSAFAGLETMKAAYQHAIQTGYKFYSYGDSSLIYRERDI